MRPMVVILLLSCLAAAPPATQQADRPVSLAEAKARGSLQSLTDLAGLPIIDVDSIDKILKLSLKDDDLALECLIPSAEQSLVRIPNFPGVSHVRVDKIERQDAPPFIMQYHFENRDYTIPSAICQYTTVSVAAGMLSLWQALETLDDRTHSVQLLQHTVPLSDDQPRVSLYVQIEPDVKLQLTADNIVELRRKHPAAVATYVDPIFQALRQDVLLTRVNTRLAWQVFADAFEPPPALIEQVNALVKELDAASFRERESASGKLESLGQDAALLLMRSPPRGLSDEQTSRIDAFVNRYKPVSDEEAAKLRRERDFLIDCLTAGDAALRAAAHQELQRVTGQEIDFDPNADPATRNAAIWKLRSTLKSPATRSAAD